MAHVSNLGLGGAALGNLYRPMADKEARAVVDAAWDLGVRYFDTAPYYGLGLSERRLGEALRQRPRAEYTLSTKVGRLLEPDLTNELPQERYGFHSPLPFTVHFDYSYDGIMRSYEESLARLGLDRIDILLVHDLGTLTHDDAHTGHFRAFASGGIRALEELRSAGDIRAIGLGVNEWAICQEAMGIGQFDIFLLAGRYTLLEQGALDVFLPQCADHGAKIILGGPYNSGILAAGTKGDGPLYYDYAPAPKAITEKVAQIEAVCEAHGVPLAAAALQFPLAHPLVERVIPGMSSPAEAEAALRNLTWDIPAILWQELLERGLIHHAAPIPEWAV